MDILRPADISASSPVGNKALRLAELAALRLPVPLFVVIPGTALEAALIAADQRDQAPFEELARRADAALQFRSYAVRSSAAIEDAAASSHAGQFLTLTDIAADTLPAAIESVARQAREKVGDLTHSFGIIVQTFVRATVSGVAFTRSPLGTREMVLQWHSGPGEDLVSGRVMPASASLVWSSADAWHGIPHARELVDVCKHLEQHFNAPQDIEWCLDGPQWYVLQTRPITTITPRLFEGMRYLDEHTPRTPFRFEKTGIAEVAPRPTAPTWDLLQRLYSDDGPVARVYHRHGINYRDTAFLIRIAGDLYVDRQREVASLMPALRVDPASGRLRLGSVKGFWTTVRNTAALKSLRIDTTGLHTALGAALTKPLLPSVDASVAIAEFLRDYEIIFEANLLAASPAGAAEWNLADYQLPHETFIGNSLELSDTSVFTHRAPPVGTRLGDRMREIGRWLTVRHVSRLRRIFGTIPPTPDSDMDLPPVIASEPTLESASQTGVSPGISEGVLAEPGSHRNIEHPILMVDALTPDLAQYAGSIAGIIARRGALLSHMAIIAREHAIPVVVGIAPERLGLRVGDQVCIDGTAGTVTKK